MMIIRQIDHYHHHHHQTVWSQIEGDCSCRRHAHWPSPWELEPGDDNIIGVIIIVIITTIIITIISIISIIMTGYGLSAWHLTKHRARSWCCVLMSVCVASYCPLHIVWPHIAREMLPKLCRPPLRAHNLSRDICLQTDIELTNERSTKGCVWPL